MPSPHSPQQKLSSLPRLFDTELSPQEQIDLQRFLTSSLGAKILRNLYINTPQPTDRADVNLSFRAGVARGWTTAVEALVSLTDYVSSTDTIPTVGATAAFPTNPDDAFHYPDLDDDKLWNDDGTPRR